MASKRVAVVDQVDARLTSQNQITVPAAVRRKLELRPGDKLRFVVEGERIVVERKRSALDDIIGMFVLPSPPSENFREEREAAWEQVARERVERMKENSLPQ